MTKRRAPQSRTALDDTLIVEAAAGTGKTTELVSGSRGPRDRSREDGRDRRRHVHRKGGGRAEAAAARSAREPARAPRPAARGRRGTARCRARERSKRRTSTRSTASAPISSASVRSRRASIRCSRCSPSRRRAYVQRAFRDWLQEALQDPPEGVRRALRRTSAAAFGGGSDGPIDRLRRRRLGTGGRPRLSGAVDAKAVRPDAEIDTAGRGAARVRRSDTGSQRQQRDNLYADPEPVRRLSRRDSGSSSRSGTGGSTTTAGKPRLVDLSRDRAVRERSRKGRVRATAGGVTRPTCSGTGRAVRRPPAVPDGRRRRSRRAACRRARGERRAVRGAQSPAGALDFLDLLARPAISCETTRSVRRHFQEKFKRIFVDEFQDTDPAAGRDSAAARRRRSGRDRLAAVRRMPASSSSSATRSSRSIDSGAPTSAVSDVCRQLEAARRPGRAAHDQLPQRARHPARS